MMLGQGMDVQSAQEKIGQGWKATAIRKKSANWRIASALNANNRGNLSSIILRKKRARGALTLLGRARKDERSSH